MTTNSIILTSEEIAEYRDQFAGLDDALYAIEIIEASDGDLNSAVNLLAHEYNVSVTRKFSVLEELAQNLRNTICDEVFIEDLMTGLLVQDKKLQKQTGRGFIEDNHIAHKTPYERD